MLTHATVYLALGAYAFDAIRRVEGVRGRMKGRFSHGAEIALGGPAGARPQTVLCTYHPSQRNVFTGLLTAEMFSDVLARARASSSVLPLRRSRQGSGGDLQRPYRASAAC